VNPADEEHIAPIVAATHALESLVDDLRTLSLSEAGALHPDREPVDVDLLVNETIEAFRAEAAPAGVRLDCRLAPDLPALSADPAQLRRVLGNLIANALAHTAKGGTVRVEASPAAAGVRITVRDDGEGITPELLPRVFERFVKSGSSTGSGLGLAIVRDLVEAHGGAGAAASTPPSSIEPGTCRSRAIRLAIRWSRALAGAGTPWRRASSTISPLRYSASLLPSARVRLWLEEAPLR